MTLNLHFKTRGELVDAAKRRVLEDSNELLKATDTSADPGRAGTARPSDPGQSSTASATSWPPRTESCHPSAATACTIEFFAVLRPWSGAVSAPGCSGRTFRRAGW
jgi:hypothetical protein